jgi:hypothetical protein
MIMHATADDLVSPETAKIRSEGTDQVTKSHNNDMPVDVNYNSLLGIQQVATFGSGLQVFNSTDRRSFFDGSISGEDSIENNLKHMHAKQLNNYREVQPFGKR